MVSVNKPQPVAVTAAPPPAVADTSALLAMIERAARDPAVDVNKMERLLEMQQRVLERDARMQYMVALSQMQPELPIISERGSLAVTKAGQTVSYALWQDIARAILPILGRHGFALSFRVDSQGDGERFRVSVTGILSHVGGHHEETTIVLPLETSGSKNPVQAVGSSVSYGKRYVTNAMLNLISSDEVDDNGAGGAISAEQAAELKTECAKIGADLDKFCLYLGVEDIARLPAARYAEAVGLLALRAKADAAKSPPGTTKTASGTIEAAS